MCSQAGSFTIRVGSLMILARLLDPKDFGLVGMVTAFTGVLNLFRDFGLSAASVQRVEVSEDQISTLFWINILVGVILTVCLAAAAPFVAAFYHEPHLLWVTVVLSSAFLFNAAGVQHSALLQRHMRFGALAIIDMISLAVSTSVGIAMAATGFGYWSLVAAAIALPMVGTLCLWLTTHWVPGRPRLQTGLRPLMRFGSGLTLVNLLMYAAYNTEKVLLGRFWGAGAVGMYGRAFQLVNIPTDNLNSAVGEVAFAALSRVQKDPVRLRSYFLKGYSLVLALTVPVTIAVALFAHDLIRVLLGPKWADAADIFRFLAPTILVFAIINPIGWLIFSLGMVGRSLKASLVFVPVVIGAYLLGLPYGPKGVAIAYSTVMMLWALPLMAWGVYKTAISLRDVMAAAKRPLSSGFVAGAVAYFLHLYIQDSLSPLFRLLLESGVLVGVYAVMLLYVMGQKTIYSDLLQSFKRSAVDQSAIAT